MIWSSLSQKLWLKVVKPILEGVYTCVITGDILFVCNSFIVKWSNKKYQRRFFQSFKEFLGLDWILDDTSSQVTKCESFLHRQISPTSNLQAAGGGSTCIACFHTVQLIFWGFSFICSERNGSAICSAFGLWSSSFMWIFESKSDLGKMILELNNFEYWVLFNVMRFVVHLFENSQNNRKLFNQKPISGALKRGQTIRSSDYRIWSRTIRFVILWKNVRKLYLFM